MATSGSRGVTRLIKATRNSLQGIKDVYIHEAAFRQELFLSVILIPAGIWLGESGSERALLAGVVILVLIVEVINSGIEAVVDRFGGEIHELSRRAKDAGSAAVFIALVNVCVVWFLILGL